MEVTANRATRQMRSKRLFRNKTNRCYKIMLIYIKTSNVEPTLNYNRNKKFSNHTSQNLTLSNKHKFSIQMRTVK